MNRMTWLRIKSGMRIVLPFGLIILFIAGCAPSHKEVMAREQMERAKKAYAEAKANPNVEAYVRSSSRKRARLSRRRRRRRRRRKRTTCSSWGTSRRGRPSLP